MDWRRGAAAGQPEFRKLINYCVIYLANSKRLSSLWCLWLTGMFRILKRGLKQFQLKVSKQLRLPFQNYPHFINWINSFENIDIDRLVHALMSKSDSLPSSNQRKFAWMFNFSINKCEYARATSLLTAFDHFPFIMHEMLFCGETIYLLAARCNSFAAENTLHPRIRNAFSNVELQRAERNEHVYININNCTA